MVWFISQRGIFFGIFLSFLIYQYVYQTEDSNISPTAHYTSYIWVKNELSPPQFRTPTGILLFWILEPIMFISRLFNGPTIENMLMARHKLIDKKLSALIESGKVTQVIEIAAGLSGRGNRFVKKYGKNITYYETDFKKMVSRKQKLLAFEGLSENHKFFPINALNPSGADSLENLFNNYILTNQGIVVITEGLLPYFTQSETSLFWFLLSKELSKAQFSIYLSDIHLKEDIHDDLFSQLFLKLLSLFVQKKVSSYEFSKQELFETLYKLRGASKIALTSPIDIFVENPELTKRGSEKVRILELQFGMYDIEG